MVSAGGDDTSLSYHPRRFACPESAPLMRLFVSSTEPLFQPRGLAALITEHGHKMENRKKKKNKDQDLREVIYRELMRAVPIQENGKKRWVSRVELVVMGICKAAVTKGDPRSFKVITDFVERYQPVHDEQVRMSEPPHHFDREDAAFARYLLDSVPYAKEEDEVPLPYESR